jgi:hypothetical protein
MPDSALTVDRGPGRPVIRLIEAVGNPRGSRHPEEIQTPFGPPRELPPSSHSDRRRSWPQRCSRTQAILPRPKMWPWAYLFRTDREAARSLSSRCLAPPPDCFRRRRRSTGLITLRDRGCERSPGAKAVCQPYHQGMALRFNMPEDLLRQRNRALSRCSRDSIRSSVRPGIGERRRQLA